MKTGPVLTRGMRNGVSLCWYSSLQQVPGQQVHVQTHYTETVTVARPQLSYHSTRDGMLRGDVITRRVLIGYCTEEERIMEVKWRIESHLSCAWEGTMFKWNINTVFNFHFSIFQKVLHEITPSLSSSINHYRLQSYTGLKVHCHFPLIKKKKKNLPKRN